MSRKIAVATAVTADRKVLLQILEDDKVLAHAILDPENARTVRDALDRCIVIAEGQQR